MKVALQINCCCSNEYAVMNLNKGNKTMVNIGKVYFIKTVQRTLSNIWTYFLRLTELFGLLLVWAIMLIYTPLYIFLIWKKKKKKKKKTLNRFRNGLQWERRKIAITDFKFSLLCWFWHSIIHHPNNMSGPL